MIQFEHIQNILKESNIDGWLLIDFRGSNSIAWDLLSIPSNTQTTVQLKSRNGFNGKIEVLNDYSINPKLEKGQLRSKT